MSFPVVYKKIYMFYHKLDVSLLSTDSVHRFRSHCQKRIREMGILIMLLKRIIRIKLLKIYHKASTRNDIIYIFDTSFNSRYLFQTQYFYRVYKI